MALLDGDEMPQLSQAGEWLHSHGSELLVLEHRAELQEFFGPHSI